MKSSLKSLQHKKRTRYIALNIKQFRVVGMRVVDQSGLRIVLNQTENSRWGVLIMPLNASGRVKYNLTISGTRRPASTFVTLFVFI